MLLPLVPHTENDTLSSAYRHLDGKGVETSSIGNIKANPDQSKHLNTATMTDFELDMLYQGQTHAVATPVVECVEKAFADEWLDEASDRVQELVSERERVGNALAGLPFVKHQWDSDANFILVQVRDAGALMNYTANNRLLLRYFGAPLDDCVRITVGSVDENNTLLSALQRFGAKHD